MDQSIDEDEEDLITKIRHFLTKDNSFREADFDPAPYLIKVLKEKEANQQLLVEKQGQLIQLQNQAQQLISQAIGQNSQNFFSILEIPNQFGVQLQRLKHGMTNVKKKVKQTKGLLLATQKDIMQIHLNCILNKLIYKRLKEVEVKMSQCQTAALALKNHLYLDCAANLPVFNGTTVLENALIARTQNLKLRFLSQAIDEVRTFLYFTPRITISTQHSFFDESDNKQSAFNMQLHSNFYKRYQLFKKPKCEEYLSSIWSLQGLDQKQGKIFIIDGIIKGIIRIGKVNEITDSLSLDCKKSVSNIFVVLFYFFANQIKQKTAQTKMWFTSKQSQTDCKFLSAVLCISSALLRKSVIVRRICSEYQLNQVCNQLASDKILEMIRDELFSFISRAYFGEGQSLHENNENDPIEIIRKRSNYIIWPYFKKKIQNCITILVEQLTHIETSFFSLKFPDSAYYLKLFAILHRKFLDLFHAQFFKTYETVFPQGRGLIPQNYDNILASMNHRPEQIQFCTKYVTEDHKSLREFVNVISYLTSIKKYFTINQFQPQKLKLYTTFILTFFYLKLNSVIFRCLISPTAYDKIIQTRLRDGKCKNKEKHLESQFANIGIHRQKVKVDKKIKQTEIDSVPLRNAEQLRMVKSQVQMLLAFCSANFAPPAKFLSGNSTDRLETELDKHEPSNYDENLGAKMIRVWQQLVKPTQMTDQSEALLSALYRRFLDLYYTLTISVYLQTGSF